MSAPPLISVCIITGRRHELLAACLENLRDQEDAPPHEVLVCADADEEVENVVRQYLPGATVIHVPKTLPSAGRNHLIEVATGEYLYFLDDDIVFGPRLLARLGELAELYPEASVFGGPNATPRASTRFQHVQGAVLASIVASGPVRRRYGAHPAGEADERWFILCNLAVRRSVMRRFDEELVCAEENALLAELHDSGERMHYDPALVVYHERRADTAGFVQQMHKYGRGRGQLIRRDPTSTHPAFLLPAGFVAYLVSLPVLAVLTPWAWAPAALYAAVVVTGAGKVAATLRRPTTFPLAAALTALTHVAYGGGLVRGVLRPGRRRHRAPVERPAHSPS